MKNFIFGIISAFIAIIGFIIAMFYATTLVETILLSVFLVLLTIILIWLFVNLVNMYKAKIEYHNTLLNLEKTYSKECYERFLKSLEKIHELEKKLPKNKI